MKPHVKNYFEHFRIAPSENIMCEVCGRKSVDLHHIEIKGMGGQKKRQKELDAVDNIIALCRKCHEDAHNGELTKSDLKLIHWYTLNG